MSRRDELAAFQALLLERLLAGGEPEDILAELRAHPDAAPYADELVDWEPRMIALAVTLMEHWGRRA